MLEIRRNISGDVPPLHFFIPMPVNQWRNQTEENVMDLTMDLQSEGSPRDSISTLARLHSPFPNVSLARTWSYVNWQDYTATPPTSPCQQRSTKTETRTCTHVCCCPSRLEPSECGTGISKVSTQTCRESGVSQSGSLI